MKNKKGSMNIEFSDVYDQEDDVYYVSFKTGEPSYVLEIDDVLLLEVGMFTNLPTGFRILNFSKRKVQSVEIGVMVKKIKKTMEQASKGIRSSLHERENRIQHTLEKILA